MAAKPPPFRLDDVAGEAGSAKRSPGKEGKGATIAKPVVPAAEFKIVYKDEVYCPAMVYKAKRDLPYWEDETKLGQKKARSDELHKLDPSAPVGGGSPTHIAKGDYLHRERSKTVKRKKFALVHSEQLGKQVWVARVKRDITGMIYTHQWGIRGDLTVTLDPFGAKTEVVKCQTLTVWERWERKKKGKNKWTVGMMTMPPGDFCGYVKAIGPSRHTPLSKWPAINVPWEWKPPEPEEEKPKDEPSDPKKKKKGKKKDTGPKSPWLHGVPRTAHFANTDYVRSDGKTPGRTGGCFFHPGGTPTAFLGCFSAGDATKAKRWGFEKRDDTLDKGWEILDKILGTNDIAQAKKTFAKNFKYGNKFAKRKWVVVRVEDPGDLLRKLCDHAKDPGKSGATFP